jgi:uncharacterized membrane protein YdjX (TVP38/TMEM64 family)
LLANLSILELILSFFITWAIGMTPPVITRMVRRRPLGKWPAIAMCAAFAFINIMIFIALGSESKSHAVVFVMAVVSYWILREEDFPYSKIKKCAVGLLVVAPPLTIVATSALEAEIAEFLEVSWIDSEVRGKGVTGLVIFFLTAMCASILGLHRAVSAFLSGYAFGAVMGVAVTLVATISGYLVVFIFVRYSSRKLISGFDFAPLKIANRILNKDALVTTIAVQLFPIGSGYITTAFAALSDIRAVNFIFGTAIAFVPSIAVFSLAGAGLSLASGTQISISALLLVISGALSLYLFRKYRHETRCRKAE